MRAACASRMPASSARPTRRCPSGRCRCARRLCSRRACGPQCAWFPVAWQCAGSCHAADECYAAGLPGIMLARFVTSDVQSPQAVWGLAAGLQLPPGVGNATKKVYLGVLLGTHMKSLKHLHIESRWLLTARLACLHAGAAGLLRGDGAGGRAEHRRQPGRRSARSAPCLEQW